MAAGVYGANSANSSYGQLGTILNIGSSTYATGVYGDGGADYGVYGRGQLYGVFSDGPTGSESYQSAAVALPDNRVVELYAMESSENWFEDFGSGELRDGVGDVALDPTFALTVNTGTPYHVFLTPSGDCQGLYVTRKTATGFQVRELRGGKSNIAFDYRVVAKRRGYEDLRMAQLEADAETVQTIREVVQSRPAHRKLILHKPPEPPKAEARPAPPAVAIPKPPRVAAPPTAPAAATAKPPE
jgi:hypothetical protein